MSFAQNQLAKYGWKQGEGLGKNRDGIKKSISVVKKNDTKGLGGKQDKWDFAWWDHVFNKSASNINVNKDESGEVKVEKKTEAVIQTSKMGIISTSRPAGPSSHSSSMVSSPASSPSVPSTPTMNSMVPRDEYSDSDDGKSATTTTAPAKSGPSWLFGFVKASTASTTPSQDTKKPITSSSSFEARVADSYDALKEAEGDEYKDYSMKVSDQDLFLACEGRTARKGARGEQPGKLGRVMKELVVSEDRDDDSASQSSTIDSSASSGSETKKGKKSKESKEKKEKKEKKERKTKEGKEKKEKKEKKAKKTKKEKKEKRKKDDKEEEDRVQDNKTESKNAEKKLKEKKAKKEKEVESKEQKTSKKRSRDDTDAAPKSSKKSKKAKE